MNANANLQAGFTVVEMMVTIVVGAMYAMVFSGLYVVVSAQTSAANQRAVASDLAYSNLRKYHTTVAPAWFVCDANSDLITYPSATGQVLMNSAVTGLANIQPPVQQAVKAFAPQGCGAQMPVKVVSTVTYGASSRTVTHATYVGQ